MIGKKKTRKSGFTMTLAVFMVILLLLTGIGVLSLGQNARIFAIRNVEEVAAQTAADAGIAKALWAMNRKLVVGWGGGLPREDDVELPNFDGTFSYVVRKGGNLIAEILSGIVPEGDNRLVDYIKSTSPGQADYVVRAIGKSGQAERKIYGTLELRGSGDCVIVVKDSIILKSGTLVDGINTDDPTIEDVHVEMGTISTSLDKIVLNNGVIVDGDVQVGMDGDVSTVIKDLGATVDSTYPMLEEPDFPVVIAPLLPDMGKITAHGETVQIGPADSGRYPSIDLKRAALPAILEITNGEVVLHITGNINMGQDCEIMIKKGASLTLYMDGDIRADESAGFNNEGVPAAFKLWGNPTDSQQLQLNAKSEYFGQIYAPNAAIIVMAKSDLYGAFTANSFEMKSGGNLFYDAALRDVDPDDEGVRFILGRWREQ